MPRFPRLLLAAALWATAPASVAQTRWLRASPPTRPPARYAAAMAYDPVRQRCLMLGGVDSSGAALTDAWEWDGSTWTQVPYPGSVGYIDPTLAHDPVGGGILVPLFVNGSYGTWRWDGVVWTRAAAQTPPLFAGEVMASGDRSVVMFGGGGTSNPHNDTWVWDGTQWTQANPPTKPPTRSYAHMAYDSLRRRVLMGGGQGSSYHNDTWEWTGSDWRNVAAAGPSPSFWGMTYDTARDRAIVVGFDLSFPWGTYELEPTGWQQRSTAESPMAGTEFALAYDEARRQTVLFGGPSGGASDETWLYEPVHPAGYSTFGIGCTTLPTPPTLSSNGKLPWLGAPFAVEVQNPTGLGVMLLGTSNTVWLGGPLPLSLTPVGLPGCQLLVSPDATTPLSAGPVSWSVVLPRKPSLLGALVHQQAVLLAPGVGPAQLVVSDAGTMRLGGL